MVGWDVVTDRFKRRALVASALVLATGGLVVGIWVAALPGQASASPADPGGRILKALRPLVRAFPSFEHGPIPWTNGDAWPGPPRYATAQEPFYDSCDGRAGTFGWDPVIVSVYFQWTGSSRSLHALLDSHLGADGFAPDSIPAWDTADYGYGGWVKSRGLDAPWVITLDPAMGGAGYYVLDHQWDATIEARPKGRAPSGC